MPTSPSELRSSSDDLFPVRIAFLSATTSNTSIIPSLLISPSIISFVSVGSAVVVVVGVVVVVVVVAVVVVTCFFS